MSAVDIDRFGYVVVLTIRRTDVLNALDATTQGQLIAALENADRDPEVRAVVLTGAGSRAFCAGADLKARSRGEALLPAGSRRGIVGLNLSTPVIAAVNGMALGLGAEIVLWSDLAVMSESATLALPEVRRGLIAAGGGAFRLGDHVPPKVALNWLLTGAPITATEALQWGLVNSVVPPGGELAAALNLADLIAAQAPLAVQATKRIAGAVDRAGDEDARWKLLDRATESLAATADAAEGTAAFVEKRAPRWLGR